MKLLIVLIFLHFKVILASKFQLKSTVSDVKLSRYICKITNNITNIQTGSKDVMIGYLINSDLWSHNLNLIAQCVDSPYVTTNFVVQIDNPKLKKALVIILGTNIVKDVSWI